ncbi:MAG: LPS export ABC transporter periplasmic protein LptC [Candidatus Latescibacteria bacterium]|nr:LPS export ABC transporter periplasmic protein LptC [Candidatus Latescibacterota bacterium]
MRRFLKKGCRVVFCLGLCACSQIEPTAQSEDLPASSDREMWAWSTQVMDRGRPRAHLQAGHFVQAKDTEQAEFAGGVAIVFFDAHGDTVSILSADRGMIDASGENMKVFGSVVVVARDSTQLQTDSLHWNRDRDRIVGDGQVEIIRPDGWETGVGFDASSDLKQWTLKHVNTQMKRRNR